MISSNNRKILVACIYGGISLENEISIKSAINIINNIDLNKFNLILIGINKNGTFHLEDFDININYTFYNLKRILNKKSNILKIVYNKIPYITSNNFKNKKIIPDIFFPITHGIFGEDGNLQGILNSLKIPYIGSNLKSSCISSNKDIFKDVLKNNNFPIIPYFKIYKNDIINLSYKGIAKKINSKKFFVKPSNQGSSIGINLIKSEKDFNKEKILKIFNYSDILLIEPLIIGKEIECGIINYFGKIKVSNSFEIYRKNNFYSYKQKYFDNNIKIKEIKENSIINKKIKNLSYKIFNILECKSLARIDFIINKNNKIFINEINTIPGFTEKSLYIKMWNKYILNIKELISIIIYSSIKKIKNL
ncbi:d-alanine--D-alanine ligase [endosymbiont of Euscepes postfasciatus]|uniref:D-alanine--D-alanine ligase n=1 Tax=endosymbiont of Euscepes postfasciatus TaxID=650377 RepID=UPI000DC7245C|nr:D-alanine--D-alanine ligase [endosymbiont of Euscepes postfasciatus]BBA84722.1 d-alanine--D-alanine ligase [endosymbiont of Euscepes postfasciatus]